jgi:hypothetical protein
MSPAAMQEKPSRGMCGETVTIWRAASGEVNWLSDEFDGERQPAIIDLAHLDDPRRNE